MPRIFRARRSTLCVANTGPSNLKDIPLTTPTNMQPRFMVVKEAQVGRQLVYPNCSSCLAVAMLFRKRSSEQPGNIEWLAERARDSMFDVN